MSDNLQEQVDALREQMDDFKRFVSEMQKNLPGFFDPTAGPTTVRFDEQQKIVMRTVENVPEPVVGYGDQFIIESRSAESTPDHLPGRIDAANALAAEARERGLKGLISYSGSYNTHDRGYLWNMERIDAEHLLQQDDEKVSTVLSALGNKQRLALLRAILDQPASANELVERLGMGTTGQVYHHLKALQAADLITQEERGKFVVRGHRVQGVLMLLAGVQALLDTRFSSGTWKDESTSPTGE